MLGKINVPTMETMSYQNFAPKPFAFEAKIHQNREDTEAATLHHDKTRCEAKKGKHMIRSRTLKMHQIFGQERAA